MLPMLAMAGLSFAGSLMSGIGQKQASAKQARLQQVQDAIAAERNAAILAEQNATRSRLAGELMQIPELSSTTTRNAVDVDGMMAAAERAGFNPVTYLNAGGLSAHGFSTTDSMRMGHNAAAAYSMMVPEFSLVSASQVPQQHSALSAIGGAVTAGANMASTIYGYDTKADAASKLAAQVAKGAGSKFSNSVSGSGAAGSKITQGGATGVTGGLSINTAKGTGNDDDYFGTGTMSRVDWPNIQSWGGMPVAKGIEIKQPEMTTMGPYGWKQDPRFPSANVVEDGYAEIGSNLYSVFKGANDVVYNMFGTPFFGNMALPNSPRALSDAKAANQGMWSELNKRGVPTEGLLRSWGFQ